MNPINSLFINNQIAKTNFYNLFEKLFNEASHYRQKYTRDDHRYGFFVIASQNILWLLTNMDALLDMLTEKNMKIDNYIELPEDVRQQYLLSHDQISRISFLIKMMFDIEDFIKNLLAQLNQPTNNGYFTSSEKFLKTLNYYDIRKHQIMTLPSQIRNSLHAGGYTDYDVDITLRGRQFKAKKGQKITFASWNDLYISFDELFNLLIEVLNFEQLKDMTFIPSKYVKTWQPDLK